MKKCFFYYFATLFLMFSNTSYAIVLTQKDSILNNITPLSISYKKPSFIQKIVLKIAEKRLRKLSKSSIDVNTKSKSDKAVLITVLGSLGLAFLFYTISVANGLLLFWFYAALGVLFLGGIVCSLLLFRKDLSSRRKLLAKLFAVISITLVLTIMAFLSILSFEGFRIL